MNDTSPGGPAGTEAQIQIVDESSMPAEVDASIRTLLCTCFPDDENVFRRTRHWHDCAPLFSVVLADGEGRALGHVGVIARTIRWDTAQVAVAGVQNVAVHPSLRGRGEGGRLMGAAMTEAARRGFSFGLLFCLPRLEMFYGALGWETIRDPIVMADATGRCVPVSEKSIGMVLALTPALPPQGPIDLQGRDW